MTVSSCRISDSRLFAHYLTESFQACSPPGFESSVRSITKSLIASPFTLLRNIITFMSERRTLQSVHRLMLYFDSVSQNTINLYPLSLRRREQYLKYMYL